MNKVPCYERPCKGNCPLNIRGWSTYDVWSVIEKGCNGSSEEVNLITKVTETESSELKQKVLEIFNVNEEQEELVLGRWVKND